MPKYGPKKKPCNYGKTFYTHSVSWTVDKEMYIYHYCVYKWTVNEWLDRNYCGHIVHVWTKDHAYTCPPDVDFEKIKQRWGYENGN